MNRTPIIAAIFTAGTLAGASAAYAQTSQVTTTLIAATDYHSKGISKSLDDGLLSIGAEWVSEDGVFYAGTAAATVDLPIGASYEADVRGGVRTHLMGWSLDFAAFYRAFPDASAGTDDDYVEARAQASRNWGPVNVRLLTWQTPDNLGPAGAANWSEAKVTWAAAPRVKASLALGHHDQDNAPTYAAWNAGVLIDVGHRVNLDLRWYDTDAHDAGERFQGEAVAALIVSYGGPR